MSGRASLVDGRWKELVAGLVQGVPTDISEEDLSRNVADLSQIQDWVRLGLTANLGRVDMAAIEQILNQVPSLLEQVGKVVAPPLRTFDVATHFVVTPQYKRSGSEVLIGRISDNIGLLVKGLVEPESPQATLKIYRLVEESGDDPIIAQLRGDREMQAILTSWGRMYEVIRLQGRGQKGPLLTNGCSNIFYIPDLSGIIWSVHCGWISRYRVWHFDAYPVTCLHRWYADDRVVSR